MGEQPPANVISAAKSAAATWKIPASVLLAQWALESGWGKHMPSGSNNPFGEKAVAGGKGVSAATTEVIHGQKDPTVAVFRSFLSITDAFDFHAEHLATSHFYAAARRCLPDVPAFCHALTGVYATDPNYGNELIAVIAGSQLEKYDAA